MAKSQSTPKTAVKKTEKPRSGNDAADLIITETYASLGRFVKMMAGLDQFCSHVEQDGPERDFAFAVATLSDMIKRDAENIREKLGHIECGGHE